MGSLDLAPFTPHPGEDGDATEIANAFAAIMAVINGGLDDVNFAAGAIFDVYKLMQRGAVDGQVLKWVGANNRWEPGEDLVGTGGGGGGGGVVSVPTGTILEWAGTTTPAGFLVCDGSAVSRTTFADLFAAIGTTYGAGNGSTTFNLPNYKGRVSVGVDGAQPEFDTRGKTGGNKTVTLTTPQIPAHAHNISAGSTGITITQTGGAHTHTGSATSAGAHTHTTDSQGTHAHGLGAGNSFLYAPITTVTAGNGLGNAIESTGATANTSTAGAHTHTALSGGAHTHPLTIDSGGSHSHLISDPNHNHGGATAQAGSGAAHDNLQPYIAMPRIIKT
jgi:microcystin-dependent protein